MNDMILNASTLPEPLSRLVQTDRVRVHESNGVITMTPFEEPFDCTAAVFGMYSDGKLSVDNFLEQKQAEKDLEF
ncbi:MAG: hypothetical protein LBT15_03900 [Synergistaceae bacterium]|jgi:hypothetical protein|nr:hypothetical protein [Synergistaceae bacterium]